MEGVSSAEAPSSLSLPPWICQCGRCGRIAAEACRAGHVFDVGGNCPSYWLSCYYIQQSSPQALQANRQNKCRHCTFFVFLPQMKLFFMFKLHVFLLFIFMLWHRCGLGLAALPLQKPLGQTQLENVPTSSSKCWFCSKKHSWNSCCLAAPPPPSRPPDEKLSSCADNLNYVTLWKRGYDTYETYIFNVSVEVCRIWLIIWLSSNRISVGRFSLQSVVTWLVLVTLWNTWWLGLVMQKLHLQIC